MSSYIERNRWFITASKLKFFLTYWPEAYKLKYIDEICGDEEEKRYFIVWTAFDDLLSYGREFFVNKYAIKEDLLAADLKKKLASRMNVKWMLKKDLEEVYYWADKLLLSETEWKTIFWMYSELWRQPLADLWWEYKTQQEYVWEYKGLKLKGTLDRISLEKWLIRDWKTSWNIDYFEYNLDTTFDYVLSMAFYYVLVKIQTGKWCEVILDVLWKKEPFPYYWYKLDKARLIDKVETKIKPWLDAMIECIETNTWESVYPIDFYTEWKHWDIIAHKRWTPINRTKLMYSWVYSKLEWAKQLEFIMPQL